MILRTNISPAIKMQQSIITQDDKFFEEQWLVALS